MRSERSNWVDEAAGRRGSRAMLIGLAISAVSIAACSTSHTELNSNTNWLRSCESDDSCGGDAQCICGLCTRSCNVISECQSPGVSAAVSCVATDSSALSASCGGTPTSAPKVCAARCTDDSACRSLGDGLVCNDGVCVAQGATPERGGGAVSDSDVSSNVDMCRATCKTPAGSIQTFASVDDVYAALAGRWSFCSGSASVFTTAPADAIGVEYERAFATSETLGANMYYLVAGPSGPVRGQGFDYQLTYDVSSSASASGPPLLQLNMHPTPNSGFFGSFRYSPCPREFEITGGINGTKTILVPLD